MEGIFLYTLYFEEQLRCGRMTKHTLTYNYMLYRLQLIRLNCTLQEKRPEYEQRHDKVILLYDNALMSLKS